MTASSSSPQPSDTRDERRCNGFDAAVGSWSHSAAGVGRICPTCVARGGAARSENNPANRRDAGPRRDSATLEPLGTTSANGIVIMNKIIWLVGAVVIVIAILSWLGLR
jgi:hypothetical protein